MPMVTIPTIHRVHLDDARMVGRHCSPNRDDNLDPRICRVIDVMQGNLDHTPKVNEMASEANLSSSHSAAALAQRTGFTLLFYYLHTTRLLPARH